MPSGVFRAVNDPSERRVANRPAYGKTEIECSVHRTVSRRLPKRVVYDPEHARRRNMRNFETHPMI